MSGSVYGAEFGVGGPSDDGVGVAVWRAFQRAEGAREVVAAGIRDRQPGGVLTALLEAVQPSARGWGR